MASRPLGARCIKVMQILWTVIQMMIWTIKVTFGSAGTWITTAAATALAVSNRTTKSTRAGASCSSISKAVLMVVLKYT